MGPRVSVASPRDCRTYGGEAGGTQGCGLTPGFPFPTGPGRCQGRARGGRRAWGAGECLVLVGTLLSAPPSLAAWGHPHHVPLQARGRSCPDVLGCHSMGRRGQHHAHIHAPGLRLRLASRSLGSPRVPRDPPHHLHPDFGTRPAPFTPLSLSLLGLARSNGRERASRAPGEEGKWWVRPAPAPVPPASPRPRPLPRPRPSLPCFSSLQGPAGSPGPEGRQGEKGAKVSDSGGHGGPTGRPRWRC